MNVVYVGSFSMFPAQYAGIVKNIKEDSNVLVFGCGADSKEYANATNGRIVFIEDNVEYFEPCPYEKYLVMYDTKVGTWVEEHVPIGFPGGLLRIKWDVVVVDGPTGFKPESPGRQLSIFTASLAKRHAKIFVHDYNRKWERECCDKYLGFNSYVIGPTIRSLGVWEARNGIDGELHK